MTKLDLFEKLIENLLSGDQIEAAYTLRMFADEIEESGVPDRPDLIHQLSIVLENEEEEYVPRRSNRESSFEDFDSVPEEVDSLFDSYDED